MAAVTRKVLIVDDDPWVGKLVEFVARDLGYEPLTAKDGAEALELFAEELPDVVIADVVLPRIDGLEVCRRVKSTGPGAFTPVLVVSGIYRSEREALKRFRADAFFAKPLSPEVLQKRLSALFPPPFAPDASAKLDPAGPGEVSLEFEPLARALARLFQKRSTGTLHVRVPGANARFLLREGRLTFARSEAWSEGIVAILQRAHRLTAEQRGHLEELVAKKGDPQAAGELAIREGYVTPDELVRLVSNQLVHRVLESFRWREGFHRFEEGASASGSKAALDLDAPSLLHWGLRRGAVGDSDVDMFLASRRTPLERHPELDTVLATLPLSRAEKWLLERADGSASFDELVSEMPASDAQARAAVHRAAAALAALGAVSAPARVEAPAAVDDVLELDVSEFVEDEVEQSPAVAPPRPVSGAACELVLTPCRQKATGTLVLDLPEGGSRELLYRDGRLIGVRHLPDERLDALLVRRGKIRPDVAAQLKLVLNGRCVADVLVELQAVNRQQLVQFLGTELRAVLREVTRLRDVTGRFLAGELSDADLPRCEWDPCAVLVEAVRSQDLSFVRGYLPGDAVHLGRVPEWDRLATGLPLSLNEKNLLNLLAAPQSWGRVAGVGLVPVEDQQRALWVLMALGLVRPMVAAAVAKAAPPPAPVRSVARPSPAAVELDPLAGIDPEVPLVDDEEDVFVESMGDAPPSKANEELLFELSSAAVRAPSPAAPASVPPPVRMPAVQRPTGSGGKVSWGAGMPSGKRPGGDTVPRALYEEAVEARRLAEQRLFQLLEQQSHADTVPREIYDHAQTEKHELKAQMVQLLDEILRLKSATAFSPPAGAPTVAAARAVTDFDDGGVISFKRRRP